MFNPVKVTAQRAGTAALLDETNRLTGYQIHHGRVLAGASSGIDSWLTLDDGTPEVGAVVGPTHVLGTTLHGLFEEDGFRRAFLGHVAVRAGKTFRSDGVSFAAARDRQIDRLADAIEEYVDCMQLAGLLASASRPARVPVGAPVFSGAVR